jgi:hypothetical protein
MKGTGKDPFHHTPHCWLVEVRKDIYFDMQYDPVNKLLGDVFGA